MKRFLVGVNGTKQRFSSFSVAVGRWRYVSERVVAAELTLLVGERVVNAQ